MLWEASVGIFRSLFCHFRRLWSKRVQAHRADMMAMRTECLEKNVWNPCQWQQREAEGKKKHRVEDEGQRQKYSSIDQCHSWLKEGIQVSCIFTFVGMMIALILGNASQAHLLVAFVWWCYRVVESFPTHVVSDRDNSNNTKNRAICTGYR